MLRNMLLFVASVGTLTGCAHAQSVSRDTGAVIESFAADYALDPHLDRELEFGVKVEGDWWTVSASPGASGAPGRVLVNSGMPKTPTFYFTTDRETLQRVETGSLNALTAMAKAWDTDAAPMDVDTMEGFAPADPSFGSWITPFIFHFWTRGQPEIVPFNSDTTRNVHGAQASIFFYQEGFRSAYFELRPGQHANADPKEQTNPFPSLFIVTKGRVNARIGGKDIVITEGNAIFIPAGVRHELMNSFDAPGSGMLLMFGKGA